MNANELNDDYISINDPSYFRKDDDWWWVELCNIFNNIPPNDKFDDQRSAGCAMQYIKSLEAEIEKYKVAVLAMEWFRNSPETSVRITALEYVWEALDNIEVLK